MKNQQWLNDIDRVTEEARSAFSGLSAEQLNWKPNPDIWSIAQNLEHLIVVNESYYPVIESVRKGVYTLPWLGKIGFVVRFFGKMILGSVQPDRKRKMKTLPIWEPGSSRVHTDILDRFEMQQQHLKKMINGCADLLDQGLVISSPANAHIVYKLETAFDIIVAHEQRHLKQAQEMLPLLS